MSIKSTVTQLKKTISLSPATFAEARERNPVLANFESAPHAMTAIGTGGALAMNEQNEVALALISEQQRAPHPLWQAMLLVAYEPLLAKLASKRGGERDEREARVIAAFLEAIVRVNCKDPPRRLALHLRGMTRHLARLSPGEKLLNGALLEGESEGEVAIATDASDGAELSELREQLLRRGESDLFDALVAIHVEEETLIGYVRRTKVGCSKQEQQAVYSQLLRRTRAEVVRLRRLGGAAANETSRYAAASSK